MTLSLYKKKRDFDKTPEPVNSKTASNGKLKFVVQKHDASHLHYDFRLEIDGALKSWAVPKGPSLDPSDKRLAIMVEDHPLEYGNFYGVIPEGNYGAGTVEIWDKGTYKPMNTEKGKDQEKILRAELKKGDIKITLNGHYLKGEVSIDEGTAFFALTGMNYRYRLKTSTENSKLLINNLTLSSTDDEARHFDIFGNIDFKDMKINSIDLNTSGDMVFLDESVSYNELGVYGYFRGGSGTPPISIKGNLDKLDITGEFLITDATISSVPLGGSGYENKIDNFTYILISDTVETAKDSIILTQASDYYKINPFARYRYTVDNMETSAKDFLNLDVKVKTQKNMYVSIDFDNLTRDRLYGEISVDIDLKTDKDEYIARGEVNILKDSYYRFYKDFKLRDSKITFDGPIDNPVLDIQAVYEGTKTTEQFGSVTSIPVNVKLTIEGELDEPKINLKLIEDGTEISGDDSQADAITFLLFGKYKSELSTSERTAVASSIGTSIGSLYISSIVSQTVRSVLPFIKDAQFKYSEGSLNDTEVELTSELGDATITIGGKLLKEIRNFEFEIEYPLNDFLNLDLPETLLLQFYREEENNIVFGSSETTTNTGLKILYKIKY